MSNRKLIFIVLSASVFGAIIALAGFKYFVDGKAYETIEKKQQVSFANYATDTSSIKVPECLDFVYAAEIVRPAVVHIKTYYSAATSSSESYQRTPFDDMLKEYFGDKMSPQEYHQQAPQEASGSGVILSPDGYIATNNHVVENADKIEVVLNDKRSYIAKLIGVDPTTDLALLKIEEKELPFVPYGDSDKMKVGEWVLAVGNPFNLTSTVTAGIISAKARNINILRDKDNFAIESFIQTDAVVNPGNSGGALVDIKGRLIGINTAIATPTGSYAGYAFAVPVTLVKKVMDDILKYGQTQRALLGVTILDINAALAKEKGITEYGGVYVAGVNPGSAAEAAGLKEGDIITSINGAKVNSSSELQEIVARNRPGDKVKVDYLRKGKEHSTNAVLKNKAGDTKLVKREQNAINDMLGAEFEPVGKEEMKKLDIENGVKIIKLNSGKLKEAGVKEGFIITSVDKNPVSKPADIESILNKNKNSGILVEGIYPNGQKAYYAFGW